MQFNPLQKLEVLALALLFTVAAGCGTASRPPVLQCSVQRAGDDVRCIPCSPRRPS